MYLADPVGQVRAHLVHLRLTVRQSLDTQVGSLRAAGVTRLFAEKISTRVGTCPNLTTTATP